MKRNIQVIQDDNIKTITVNDLNHILQKHFHCSSTFIESIEVADLKHMWKPLKYVIGVSGVLNITFSASRKLK